VIGLFAGTVTYKGQLLKIQVIDRPFNQSHSLLFCYSSLHFAPCFSGQELDFTMQGRALFIVKAIIHGSRAYSYYTPEVKGVDIVVA